MTSIGDNMLIYTYIRMHAHTYAYVYLVAFAAFRHRAWAVGQRPLGCLFGSLGKPLGSLLEVVLSPLGASWVPF